jgi:hypothetical protein
MMIPNLFKALSHYGSSQSENYLTESFVHVLRVLKVRARPSLVEMVRRLPGLNEIAQADRDVSVKISTQSSLAEGRPDIRFDIGLDLKVFVEVKDWAPLPPGQLESYYKQIRDLFGDAGCLVLPTRSRHSVQDTGLDPSLFHHVCWYVPGSKVRRSKMSSYCLVLEGCGAERLLTLQSARRYLAEEHPELEVTSCT